MKPDLPVSLNLSRKTKFVNGRVVHKNSFCGTLVSRLPPIISPCSIRQVLFMSPSQPANDLPSNSGNGWAAEASNASRRKPARTLIRERLFIEPELQDGGRGTSFGLLRRP